MVYGIFPESIQRRICLPYHGKYTSPSDLMNDRSLSQDEKIAMLEQWRDDKKALLRASEEGMEGHDPSEVLRIIKKYLRSLKEGTDR